MGKFNPADSWETRQQMAKVILLRELQAAESEDDLRQRLRAAFPAEKPVVELARDFPFYGIVIEAPTGVLYTNQCGGTACVHPKIEGYLMLIDFFDTEHGAGAELEGYWFYDKHLRPDADLLDGLDRQIRLTCICYQNAGIRLDRQRAEDPDVEWGEAWIPVTCNYGRGFLTYTNSD